MRKNAALSTIALLLLTACSTLTYKEPLSGSRARVRFVTETKEISVVRTYDDASCSTNEEEMMRLRVGYLINSNPKRLGLPLWDFHENAAKEVYVDASRPKYYLFSGDSIDPQTNSIYSCAVAFAFPFEADKSYEVFLKWHPQNCRIVISELQGQGSAASRVQLKTITNQLTQETRDCYAQFAKTRLY
jgi:hypothetical protein